MWLVAYRMRQSINQSINQHLFCWVTLKNADVHSNTKFYTVHMPYVNLKFHICYFDINVYIFNEM
jgi:hypothetical protein